VKQITIYTDGACLGNPGPGGYGVVLLYDGHQKELSGGYRKTTNNRMEMMAAIVGLRALKQPCTVTLYSDSRYVVQAMSEGWAERWRAKGWKRNAKELAKNPDLWAEMLDVSEQHDVSFKWVKGHAGNIGNERCDALAVAAANRPNLPRDEPYEAR
jgi:ribonuclease HI